MRPLHGRIYICTLAHILMTSLSDLHGTLKLLAEPTRLRLLGLLAHEELAVHELVRITGVPQSRVSNHLSLLKRAGLVRDRREGSWAFHSLVPAEDGGAITAELFAATIAPWWGGGDSAADRAALEVVREQRRERSREAHDALADRWTEVGQEFRSGAVRSEAVAWSMPSGMVAADLGCGAGFLSRRLSDSFGRVIAVDHSEKMLETARERGLPDSVELRRGELDKLPIDSDSVDTAFAHLVWHHLADLSAAAREIARILKPGGTVVISDLMPHDQDWMRDAMGDLRLGMPPETVRNTLDHAGFGCLRVADSTDGYQVTAPGGESTTLAMFLVRGELPR